MLRPKRKTCNGIFLLMHIKWIQYCMIIIIIVNLRFFLEFCNKVLIIIPMYGFLHGMRENSEKKSHCYLIIL